MKNTTKNKRYTAARGRRKQRSNRNDRKSATLRPEQLISKRSEKQSEVFRPAMKFQDMALDSNLLNNIAKKGYEWPTEIQEASIGHMLEGRNLVGVASTGTGKTAAFLIPLIQRLLTEGDDFTTLIVVPTRELALQVEEEFKSLTRGLGLYASCFIGGTHVGKDIEKLRRKNHFIIGTPGRLLDMYERQALRLEDISVLILDEFDRMLDMGFVNDIKRMVAAISDREQTLLFSATIDPTQKGLIRDLVYDPVMIRVNNGASAADSVEQHIVRLDEGEDKFARLIELISGDSFEKVIVFAETKRMVDKLSKKLNRSGVNASHIHGDKSQNFRNRAIKRFRNGGSQVLVATDVAARGIDIDMVSHVINYQMPRTMDSYVHRIGRTGRAGNKGTAYTFVD